MSEVMRTPVVGPALVVGGGIAGLTAALELAETGCDVILVEKGAYLGGRVAQMARYFPKLCPPSCGLEINLRRLRQNPRIRPMTLAEVVHLEGRPGAFVATIKVRPRFVTEQCTACGECLEACPVERPDEHNYGMKTTKAVYLPHPMAFPMRMTIDPGACPGKSCSKCVPSCKYGAIDLEMPPSEQTVKVQSVIVATGWRPYDASRLETLGFGKHKNVITNTMMERLAAVDGPTGGQVLRPSDGKPPKHVTFVQCAGSRDENHLSHCSAVCCLASLKQTTYVLDQNKDAKVHIFYIDLRTPGRNEQFRAKVTKSSNVALVRGKVAQISEYGDNGNLIVEAEDTQTGQRLRVDTEMVVLATGMAPNGDLGASLGLAAGTNGFLVAEPSALPGVEVAGCVRRPADVASTAEDATAAALHALRQCAMRSVDG